MKLEDLQMGSKVRFKEPIGVAKVVDYDDDHVYFRHDKSPAVFSMTKSALEDYLFENGEFATTPGANVKLLDVLHILNVRQGYIEASRLCNADKPNVLSELLGASRTIDQIRDAVLSLVPTAEQEVSDDESD